MEELEKILGRKLKGSELLLSSMYGDNKLYKPVKDSNGNLKYETI